MTYSKKVIDHFKNPHNQGVIKDADAVGKVGNPVCGDVMKIYLKIGRKKASTDSGQLADLADKQEGKRGQEDKEYIEDIKFETLGCAAAIAVSSALTDMVKGKSIDEALQVTKDQIVDDLGGLPPVKVHCSMLGVEALHKAIEEYRNSKQTTVNSK